MLSLRANLLAKLSYCSPMHSEDVIVLMFYHVLACSTTLVETLLDVVSVTLPEWEEWCSFYYSRAFLFVGD